MTPKDFLELIQTEGIMFWLRKGHIVFSGGNDTLTNRLSFLLAEQPDFEAAVIQLMNSITPADFVHELKCSGLGYSVEDNRVKLTGSDTKAIIRCAGILSKHQNLEAQLIMIEAARNPVLLDTIKERACMRWEQGYSDSLYMAVLGNITDTHEEREYLDKPDEAQAAFLRRMGFSKADIQDKAKCPSAWLKLKPRSNWDAELAKYEALMRV